MDTLQYVRACLDSTDESFRAIARGAGVTESWVRMFKHGRIPNPGYNGVKALADYFMRSGASPHEGTQQSAMQRQRRQMG